MTVFYMEADNYHCSVKTKWGGGGAEEGGNGKRGQKNFQKKKHTQKRDLGNVESVKKQKKNGRAKKKEGRNGANQCLTFSLLFYFPRLPLSTCPITQYGVFFGIPGVIIDILLLKLRTNSTVCLFCPHTVGVEIIL